MIVWDIWDDDEKLIWVGSEKFYWFPYILRFISPKYLGAKKYLTQTWHSKKL